MKFKTTKQILRWLKEGGAIRLPAWLEARIISKDKQFYLVTNTRKVKICRDDIKELLRYPTSLRIYKE